MVEELLVRRVRVRPGRCQLLGLLLLVRKVDQVLLRHTGAKLPELLALLVGDVVLQERAQLAGQPDELGVGGLDGLQSLEDLFDLLVLLLVMLDSGARMERCSLGPESV